MTPSATLYNQIRWDDRFDASRWILGIEARQPEPKRVALVDFVPGGDIPWHRVLYFEADSVVVWDRRSGIDHTATASVGRRAARSPLPAPLWSPRTILRWDGSAWSAAAPSAPGSTNTLRMLTWNVLFDRFCDGTLQSDQRRPAQADAIAGCGADVIALQEVQYPLLRLLLAHPTIRAHHHVILSGPPREVDDDGLVLLCRPPPRAAGHVSFGPHKGALGAVLDHWSGPVATVTTHLTSAHTPGAPTIRSGELSTLRQALDAVDASAVVLGDFNDPGDAPNHALGLRDVGVHAPTFDPHRNPLALWSSLTGDARRIDRVLVAPNLLGRDPRLCFEAPCPTTGQPLSDHYGVQVVLFARPSTASAAVPHAASVHTALAWLPSAATAAPLDAIRRAHDPAFARWPAHVNVHFGFVPEHAFEAAVQALTPALSAWRPFSVRLATTGRFATPGRPRTWADPSPQPAGAWTALARTIDPLVPGCTRRHTFRPHLTLGAPPADLPAGPPLEDTVAALTLLSRRGDGPMRPRATLPFGGAPVWLDPSGPPELPTESPQRTDRARAFVRTIQAALPGCCVHLVGSRALDVPLADSDIDLVAVHPESTSPLVALRHALGPTVALTEVEGARVPGIRLDADGLSTDIALVQCPPALPPAEAVRRRADFPEPLERALSAVSDARVLARRLAPFGDTGRAVLQTIRAWSRARGLHSRPLGGLPSLGWAVLVVHALERSTGRTSVRDHLIGLFEDLADTDWSRPIALDPTWPGAATLPMQVGTPSAPIRPCSDAVTPQVAALIQQELVDAWALLADGSPLATLLAPPPLHRRHAAWAEVVVHDAAHTGRIRGRLRALLDTLAPSPFPGVHAWPWSWQTDEGHHTAIGLGLHPPGPDQLARLLAPWRATCADWSVTVRHQPGHALDPPVWPTTPHAPRNPGQNR